MYASRLRAAALAAACVMGLLSCGSKSSLLAGGGGSPAPATDPRGLPALDKLPAPTRDLSALAADGFLPLDPVYPLYAANALDGGGYLQMDNPGGVLTYAVFGIGGFDGDNYPVSVKLDVGSGGANFYIAFSDYHAGNWAVTGPFNDDGEFGIPGLDGYDDPSAFTSGHHNHYFAIIVPDGNAVNVDAMWLGVSGGDNAPEPVLGLEGAGSANGFYLTWPPSTSYQDPDFAGYILERAPLFNGGFSPLAASPALPLAFNDATAVVGETYRYRVVSFDLAGNFAVGGVQSLGPQAGEEADPVIDAQMPRGPLFGPVKVKVDLSGSFDPEGEGITTYEIQVFNPLPVQMAGPVAEFDLEPGCHLVFCHVQCADLREDSYIGYIKVLPQWESSSNLLRASDPTLTYKDARLSRYRAGVQPSDGLTTVCGYDSAAMALTFWHQQGAVMAPFRAKQLEFITAVGEPVTDGDNLLFPVASTYNYYIAAFDGANINLTQLDSHDGYNVISLVKDNAGRFWYFFPDQEAATEKIFIEQVGSGTSRIELDTTANSVNYIDAVLEPASGHLFAFYDDGTALTYTEWDPDAAAPVGSGPLGVANFGFVLDAEINPENGRVAVMYWDTPSGQIRYLEQDGLGGWTLPVDIDNSDVNLAEGDLCPSAAGQLNAFFPLDNGQQSHRYIYSGGSWGMENTVAYSSNSGYDIALAPVPGSPDMRVVDNCDDGVIRLARLKAGNTENVFASIDSAVGQGFDMHAASGTDGIHLIFSNVHDFNKVTHMLSPVGATEGSLWNEVNSFTATEGLNLESTSDGVVYASGYTNPNSTLYWWDSGAGNFVADQAFPSSPGHRPLLGSSVIEEKVTFGVWDDLGMAFNSIQGKHGAYDPPDSVLLANSPVWGGACVGADSLGGFFNLAGPSEDQPAIFFTRPGSSFSDLLANILISNESSPYDKPCLAGRVADGAVYWSGNFLLGGLATDLLASNGGTFYPTRFKQTFFGGGSSEDLPMGTLSEDTDFRRSVSASNVGGLTAVDLVATPGAEDSYFAWSNFGNWETLDLPPGLDGMSLPLLVCGNDGRWHIIYKNWKTDEIMIRSTI